jgi:hypothetical protein
MEPPAGGSNWRLVELRPVSEGISYLLSLLRYFCNYNIYTEFADLPLSVQTQSTPPQVPSAEVREAEPVVPSQAPTTLMQWAVLILNTPNPTLKVRTRHFLAKSARVLTNNITG